MKKGKKILSIVIASLLIVAMIVGAIFGVRSFLGSSTVLVVEASNLNYGGWNAGGMETEGTVTSDVSQNIYVGNNETIKEVKVEKGDKVKEGDLLIVYDGAKTELAFEKEQLNVEQIKLRLEVAKRNLETLKKIAPIPEGGDDGGYDDGGDFPEEPEEGYKAKLYKKLDGKSKAYNEKDEDAGTEDNPLRFLCTNGCEITPAFVRAMKKLAGKNDLYYRLEIREDDEVDGAIIRSWTENAKKLANVSDEWRAYIFLQEKVTETPTPTPTPDETPTPTDTETPTTSPTTTETPTTSPTTTETTTPTTTETTTPTTTETTPETSPSAEPTGGGNEGVAAYDVNYAAGLSTKRFVAYPEGIPAFTLIDTDAETGSSAPQGNVDLIPSNAEYTASERKEAIESTESDIKTLELDLREAELKLSDAKEAAETGEARAKMNGVVTTVGDIDNPGASSPFLSVSASEGLYIRGGISEMLLDRVHVGDEVSVMSWETGESYFGTVTDVSLYPDTSGMFGWGDTQTTFYPFTVHIDGDVPLSEGSWVQLGIAGSSAEEDIDADSEGMAESDTLYLWRAFIINENGKKYVYKRGEDGKLVKQEIVTGPRSDQGYEIISGITSSDFLAFPYGKNVKEGAATREGTMEELYSI